MEHADRRSRGGRRLPRFAVPIFLTTAIALGGSGIAGARSAGPTVGPPRIEVDAPEGFEPATSLGGPAASAPGAVAQAGNGEVLGASVLGGDIRVDPGTVTVSLTASADGTLRGRIDGVRVVDARGTLTGWRLEAATDGVLVGPAGARRDSRTIRLSGVSAAPFDGQAAGLSASEHRVFQRHGTEIARAQAGFGGGTYIVGADVEVAPRHGFQAAAASLVVSFAIVTR
jgi:hypothetical protein